MKINKFKIIVLITMLIICSLNNKSIYAISDNFKFVIDTIGIPRYNVYGKEINEEIYKAYNVFSYGIPENLSSGLGQRWKNSKYGLWSKSIGAYNGRGTRGEYNLIGMDYKGNVINNYYFPVDALPNTTPDKWNYYYNPGAAASWNDRNKYKYIEQLEYMKSTKLLFNDISSRDNSDNPKKTKEYNITALKIGLDKARLDVCSTWKTNGIIHTRRRIGNRIRYAVFLTNPMAATANVKSSISVEQNSVLRANKDEIKIDILYDAKIINMTGYAKKTHIKEIKSMLYINGKEVDSISGSKIDTLGTKYMLTLSRKELAQNKNNIIKIKNRSYAHTEFAVDGLMQDEVEKTINIFVEEKELIPVKINEVKILEKNEEGLVVRPLTQYRDGRESRSVGITEAGRFIAIKLDVNNNAVIDEYENIKVTFDDEKVKDLEITKSENSKNALIKLKIPTYVSPTIYGWKSLRELYGNYFEVKEDRVGKIISNPHVVNIKTRYNNKENIISFKIDTIDDYVTNINYRYEDGFNINKGVLRVEEWLNEN